MRLRKALVPLGAVVGSALLPGAAHAAVPNRFPQSVYHCPEEPGKVAKVWWRSRHDKLTQLAVENQCSTAYVALNNGLDNGYYARPQDRMLVAPGVHFNWGQGEIKWARKHGFTNFERIYVTADGGCDAPTKVIVVYGHKDIRACE